MIEFDLDMIYTRVLTKKELIELINKTYDKEFIVVTIPRTKDNADLLIRSKKEILKKGDK